MKGNGSETVRFLNTVNTLVYIMYIYTQLEFWTFEETKLTIRYVYGRILVYISYCVQVVGLEYKTP